MLNKIKKQSKKKAFLKTIFLLFILCILSSGVILQGCGEQKAEKTKPVTVDSTAIKDSLARFEEENLKITYHYFPVEGKTTYSGLKKEFSEEEIKIILGINRLDKKNFGRRDSVVVPDTFFTDLLKYTSFPHRIELAYDVKKLILFSYTIQAYAAYENGRLVKWGPTSLGKKSTPTPNGLYHTNWKAKKTISTVNPEWILPWAFNLDNFEGVSMHEFDLPGYPASHACARLWSEDAQWFYYWAEQWVTTNDQEDVLAYGTPVIIYGKYAFGKRPPWRYLPQSADTTKETSELVTSVVKDYIKTIVSRQDDRVRIIAEREKEKALEEQKKEELSKNNPKSGGGTKSSSSAKR